MASACQDRHPSTIWRCCQMPPAAWRHSAAPCQFLDLEAFSNLYMPGCFPPHFIGKRGTNKAVKSQGVPLTFSCEKKFNKGCHLTTYIFTKNCSGYLICHYMLLKYSLLTGRHRWQHQLST